MTWYTYTWQGLSIFEGEQDIVLNQGTASNKEQCIKDAFEKKPLPPIGYHTYLHLEKTCAFPTFLPYTLRLDTYKEWPKYLDPPPSQLAAAGFFYTGTGDHVTCYCCGLTLKDWCWIDNPVHRHLDKAKDCEFLVSTHHGN